MEDVRDKGHIVICGWNDGGIGLIQGLITHYRPKTPTIVLVNELPRESVDAVLYRFPEQTFKYVRGNFTKEEILARANVRAARAAIILADESGPHPPEKRDERTIFGALAVKAMSPKVKTCAELTQVENREHLRRANVDEIVVHGEYNAAILAGAASATGLSTVMKRLLDIGEDNKLWRTRIHERFVGRPVSDLADHVQNKYQAILLAVVTETAPIALEDILSPDASAIDDFIKRKFAESGKDYFSGGKGRVSVQINPPRDLHPYCKRRGHCPGPHQAGRRLHPGKIHRPGYWVWLMEGVMTEETDFLREIYIFQDLTQQEIEFVAQTVTTRQYVADEIIMREGETGDTMYIIGEGAVQVHKALTMKFADDDYRETEKTLSVLRAEDHSVFGEMSLVSEERDRPP